MRHHCAPEPRLSFPKANFPSVRILDQGIKIIHLPMSRSGLISIRLLFNGGADSDVVGQAGCCSLADEVLAQHINRNWKQLPFGGDVSVNTGWSSSTLAIDGHQSELFEMAALLETFLSIRKVDSDCTERQRFLI